MFQKAVTLFLCAALLAAAEVVKQEYLFDAPVVKDGIAYCDGCRQSTYAFEPSVAVRPSYIALPIGTKAKSITIEYGDFIELPGTWYLQPVLLDYSRKSNPYDGASADQPEATAVYSQDRYFPGINTAGQVKTYAGTAAVTQYLCGTPICVTVLTPVQYNPVQGTLAYYDRINVTLETEPVADSDDVAAAVITPFTKSRISRIVDNKEHVGNLPLTPQASTDYEYLIISRPDILSVWDPFIEFNTRRGMRTKIVSVASIPTGSGDLATRIRTFIKQEYTQNKILFVLLGGDVQTGTNNMPARLLTAEFYDHHIATDRHQILSPAADMYFGTLDGTWDNNNNGTYGEPGEEDMFWEVFVARFSCRTAADAQNLISKTINYSETPVRASVTSFLGAGEWLWENNGVDIWGKMSVEQYIGIKDANSYTTYGINSTANDFTIAGLYDQDLGRANAWSATDLRTKVGQNKPAIIAHDGHGNPSTAFGISQSNITTVFSTCNGTTANYFLGITGACSPGQFHTTNVCFSEFLVNTSTAAIGIVSSCLFGYGDDDGNNSPTGRPYRFLFDALFNPAKRVHFQGPMHDMGKEANADIVVDPQALSKGPYYGIIRYCCYNTNLFGDPALSVWTKTPMDVTASTFPCTADKNAFTMRTPPNTMVALANPATGDIFATQLTGYTSGANNSFKPDDSVCVISSDDYKAFAASNTQMKVIVKAHNYIAGSFNVSLATGALTAPAYGADGYSVKRTPDHTFINLNLATATDLTVGIFNLKGECLQTLRSGKALPGSHQVKISNNRFARGMYYCRIVAGTAQRFVQPIMLGN
ncbi:MAG: hypothetical protein JW768_04300 [Chitinispirillaceae bacterium]|nr:hypothetical protein [Chitinispirillaceae bacterium]